MTNLAHSRPNPKRVAAGRRNRKLRGPLTAEGREKLREAAVRNRPWERSTGPKTPEGKARSAANGRKRRGGKASGQRVRAKLADADALMKHMAKLRELAER